MVETQNPTKKDISWSEDELDKLETELQNIGDFQRFSSILVWIGIAMIILHILADIYFHTI